MPSVVGLLEQREFAARRLVDGLREEADRIQAELAAAADVDVQSASRDVAKPKSQVLMWPPGVGLVGAIA